MFSPASRLVLSDWLPNWLSENQWYGLQCCNGFYVDGLYALHEQVWWMIFTLYNFATTNFDMQILQGRHVTVYARELDYHAKLFQPWLSSATTSFHENHNV